MALLRRTALKDSASLMCLGIALSATPALANPSGGQVSSGSASISNPSASKTVVSQSSQGVVINWKSFDINKGETTQFVQPNAKSVAINRIGSQNASQILGTLSANGQVVLINPNGIAFGKNSKVNVGALIATTTDGTDDDVLAGRFTENGNQNAGVSNAGRVTANGTIALVAPNVSNSGIVNAKIGSVSLGGANKFTVDFNGDGLISFAAGDASKASASNTGRITGANVSMTARTADGLATGVVNTSGIVTATGVNSAGGSITLDAGTGGSISVTGAKIVATGRNGGGNITVGGWNHSSVNIDKLSNIDASAIVKGNAGDVSIIAASVTVKGSIKARGGRNSGDGGKIETSGHTVDFGGARIDAGAKRGDSGEWLLDPVDIIVDASGAATIMAALATSDVSLASEQDSVTGGSQIIHDTIPGYTPTTTSGPGDFYLLAPITWSSSHTLQIGASHSTYIYAPITVAGSGELELLTNEFANNSGGVLDIGAPVTFLHPESAIYSVNGFHFTLETSFESLVNDANADPSGYYALVNDVSAAGTAYTSAPITELGLSSSTTGNINIGIIDGLGHSISGLTVQTPDDSNAALIGTVYTAATVQNLHLTDVNISSAGTGTVGALAAMSNIESTFTNVSSTGTVSSLGSAGGLFGQTSGTIAYSWSSASVTGGGGGSTGGVGGFAGVITNNGASVTNSYATGDVTGDMTNVNVGGFVGFYEIDIHAGTPSSLSNDYATGAVLANIASAKYVGGFAGNNQWLIDHSYATGSVTAQGTNMIGGFAGNNNSFPATLDTVYASGRVTATSGSIGGLAGGDVGTGAVKNSVWDKDSTGVAIAVSSGPAAAASTVSVDATTRYTASAYTPFTFTTTAGTANAWVIVGVDSTLNSGSGSTRPMLASEYSRDIANAHQLQLTLMNVAANYYVTGDFDAKGTGSGTDVWSTAGFLTVTNETTSNFTGNVDGLGSVISNLTIAGSQTDVAVFGRTSGTISNIEFLNPTVNTAGSSQYVGVVVGRAFGPITNVSIVGGSVTASGSNPVAGGLAGEAWSTVSNSYSTASVTGGSDAITGGLVGWVRGGSIAQSFATGGVAGGAGAYAGGLVGLNAGTISDAFAMGDVSGSIAGGLIGLSQGSTSNAFSTGMVTGATRGGAIGQLSGTTTNVYWDTQTSGIVTDNGAATGKTTNELQASLLTGLDDENWSVVAGASFPYLNWMSPDGTPQVVSGKLYSDRGVTAIVNGGVATAIDGRTPSAILALNATAADGYFYELLSPGAISSAGSNIAVYATGTPHAVTYSKATDSLTNVALYGGWTRDITADANYTQAASDFAAAIGGLSITKAPNLEVDALASSFLFNTAPVFSGNKLMLVSNGIVQETVGLTADKLIVGGTGTFAFSAIYNNIGSVSGGSGVTTGTGALRLLTASPLTVDNITIHELMLQSGAAITVSGSVNTVYAGFFAGSTLKSTGIGKITAISAYATSIGGLSLTGANQITTFNELYNEGSGDIVVTNNGSLNLFGNSGLLGNAAGGKISISTTGDLTTYDSLGTSNNMTLHSGGTLTVWGTIGSGRTLTLTANSIDTSHGFVNANTLTGSSAGAANMYSSNTINVLGDFTTGGAFSLFDADALNVTGAIDTAGHDLFLRTIGTLTLRGSLSGSTVSLESDSGAILEKNAGVLFADLLNVSAFSGYNLSGPNDIGSLGTIQTWTGQKKLVQHGSSS